MAYDLYDGTQGQLHDWVFAGLPLVTHEQPNSGFWFETYADGFSLGSADALSVIRESLLLDGDDETIERYGNRTINWTTAVCGYTMADVIAGERVLSQRMFRSTTLVFTPPGSGASTVFDVRTSQMDPVENDLAWIAPGVKYQAYALTIKAGPWGYAESTITETFAPGATTVTVVDACSANTNWPGMTATTHLGQSAVRLGPLTASEAFAGTTDSRDPRDRTIGGAAGGRIPFTGTVPAANYMYIDFASAFSGYTGTTRAPFLVGSGFPIAAQRQADGYMRYFWARKAGPLSFEVSTDNMNPGDTVSFYVDEFGTATVLPTGSLYLLSMKGSVRVPAQLQITGNDSDNNLGQVMISADPTYMTHGWVPDNDATWINAPDGTYWMYVQPTSYVAGDVYSIVIADQYAQTTTEASSVAGTPWLPLGPFYFGGRRSRRLGTVTGLSDSLNLRKNGVLGSGIDARLIREHPDAALIHVDPMPAAGAGGKLFVDPPTLDQPMPGMFAGEAGSSAGVSVMRPATFGGRTPVRCWAWPMLVPPLTALWVKTSQQENPTVQVVHRPAFHTFAAEN